MNALRNAPIQDVITTDTESISDLTFSVPGIAFATRPAPNARVQFPLPPTMRRTLRSCVDTRFGADVGMRAQRAPRMKGLYSACWGGLMSTRAHALQATGAVIDGRIRDINEHRDLGFPVFARETSILGSNTFTRASEINLPLQFKGDLWINPGDVLVGDADGVVVVPPSLMDQVIQLCHERAEIDARTMEALRNGQDIGGAIKRFRKV
ncbi:hypothetical protein NM208_g2220 [Fusarium decemcellulare]|uniref:Uncharacterized protein n=1 Tax=Fusarium decemcellulare TaxID=57161 RepID=A0ACC1STE2_9HYPO|nr:hypothetical protein NM208_g2220 [Fusarium decemcellulare]